jgi:tRNA pseudouridine13 synthase
LEALKLTVLTLELAPHVPEIGTADLAGTGGRIGPELDDFVVDEVPAYAASGAGEHLYIQVQKRGLTTPECIDQIAKAAGVHSREIGCAGMKDKHAVTSQWLSLPARGVAAPESWALDPAIAILAVSRHGNKLRTGHLLGNRFRIRLVEVESGALDRARAIVARLNERGLYNYFGTQRFGRGGSNLVTALRWLSGNPNRAGRFHKKLYPSVIQSEVFNRYLSERRQRGLEQLLSGEVMRLGTGHALFCVRDLPTEQHRYEAKEIHPTGPIVGPKMRPAEGAALELEQRVMAELGLSAELCERLGEFAPGTRRDLRIFPEGLAVEQGPDDSLLVSFALPAGSYATQLIAEFTRQTADTRAAVKQSDAAESPP